jgi:hypothetical protein
MNTTTQTDTPETDAELRTIIGGLPAWTHGLRDLCRKLERERDAALRELTELRAYKASVLAIVAAEVALEDKDRPGDCPASHNRANYISDAILAIDSAKDECPELEKGTQ